MPNSVSAKIKSGLSLRVVPIVLLVLCLLLVGLIYAYTIWMSGWRTLSLRGESIRLEVAYTAADQAKGLSGRAVLPSDQGMLFAFPGDAVRCFWMKDTHIMLDMIWLDSTRKVLYIEPNVEPSSYPQTFCAGNRPARYVIELNANAAQSYGVKTGDRLSF